MAVLERELEFVMLDAPANARADALAVGARAAKRVGAGPARLSALTGLSRQAIYDALKRRPSRLPRDMEFVIAAYLAKHAETPESLAGLLAVSVDELRPVLAELERRRMIKVAVAGDRTQVLLAGERASEELRMRLEERRWVHLERFSVYARLADGERHNIRAAASEILGDAHFAILNKGIAHHVTTDELAFAVGAESRREALETAQELWRQVREAAGLPFSFLPLADIIDPVRRAA